MGVEGTVAEAAAGRWTPPLLAALLTVMVAVGLLLGWRVLERGRGVAGTEGAVAFATEGDALFVLRQDGGEVELLRIPSGLEPELLWRGKGAEGAAIAAGPEGVIFSVCSEPRPAAYASCAGTTRLLTAGDALRELPGGAIDEAVFHRGRVVFRDDSGVVEVDPRDGSVAPIRYGDRPTRAPENLVGGAEAIYWSDVTTVWVRPADGAPRILHDGRHYVQRLAAIGDTVYLLEARVRPGDPASGRVTRLAPGRPEVLIEGLRDPSDMAVTDRAIVVIAEEPDGAGVTQRALFAAPREGGTLRRWRTVPPAATALVSDGRRVFVQGDRIAALDFPAELIE